MRAALAIAACVVLLLAAAAPHVHHGTYGSHACAACVVQGAGRAASETPDVEPRPVVQDAPREPAAAPVTGVALGSIPGQSPPLA